METNQQTEKLQHLQEIRSRLDQLRNDRTSYIKSADVEKLFSTMNIQLLDLQELGGDSVLAIHNEDKSQVARSLEEVLLLMSLTYMTIGKNNEPPAVYSILVVIKILLHHLMEAGVYSRRDLKAVEAKFEEIDGILQRAIGSFETPWIEFFEAQVASCRQALVVVKRKLDGLSPLLDPLYEKLVSLRRQITAAGSRARVVSSEIKELQESIAEIEDSRRDGKFLGSDGSVPEGQELVIELLDQCKFIANAIVSGELKVDPTFTEVHKQLTSIKGQLEKLALTQAWSMRETDLFEYLQQLRKIDGNRVNGKFVGSDGLSPEDGQKFLLYLLRKSYATIYELLSSSKPVSESLQPIFNQLSTLKKCLLEVQNSGGISSTRELFPFSIKLASIDNLRKDGKFYVGNEIPEGQGSVNGLLEECYEICHELRCQTEDS